MSTIPFIGARGPVDQDDVDRDTWTTPSWITRALGRVWLDPCSNVRSLVNAERTFRFDHGQDGLKLARYVPRDPPGIVFINPPYSRFQVIRWVRAYRHTRFVFLLRHDTSTAWFRELIGASGVVAQPLRRVNFDPPPDLELADGVHNNPFPHSLFARDADDISLELRALCALFVPMKGPSHA